jgi:hypothetical protein
VVAVVVVVVVVVAVMAVMMVVIVIAMAMMMVMVTVMVDVMMSIMIGRNNSRAPWQAGEDRVCLREQERFVSQFKDREFPKCAERRIREFKGARLYASITIFVAYSIDFSCA